MYSSQFTVSLNDFNYSQNPSDLLCQYILKNYTNITLPDTLTEQWISQNLPDTPMTSQIINFAQKNQIRKYNSVIHYGYVFFIIFTIYLLIYFVYEKIKYIYPYEDLESLFKKITTEKTEKFTPELSENKNNMQEYIKINDFLILFPIIPIILLLFFKVYIHDVDSSALYLWLAFICSTYAILIKILFVTKKISFLIDESSEIFIIYSFVFLLSYFSYNDNNLYFLFLLIVFFVFFISNIFETSNIFFNIFYIFSKIINILLNLFIFIFSIYLLTTFDFNIKNIKNINTFAFISFLLLLVALFLYNKKDNYVFLNLEGIIIIFILSFLFLIIAMFVSYTFDINKFYIFIIIINILFIITFLFTICNIYKQNNLNKKENENYFNIIINYDDCHNLFYILIIVILFNLTINKYIMYTLLFILFFLFSFLFVSNDDYKLITLFIFSFLFFIKTSIDTFVDY